MRTNSSGPNSTSKLTQNVDQQYWALAVAKLAGKMSYRQIDNDFKAVLSMLLIEAPSPKVLYHHARGHGERLSHAIDPVGIFFWLSIAVPLVVRKTSLS